MADAQIAVGSTVQLKSGGPVMTVTFIGESGKAVCTWFDDKNQNQTASFPLDALNPFDTGESLGFA